MFHHQLRCLNSFLLCITNDAQAHLVVAVFGEMFAEQGWLMELPWIMTCSLVFSSSTYIAALSLLLVQHPFVK